MFVKDDVYKECSYPEREDFRRMRPSYKRENSADSIDLLDSQDLRPNSEGTFCALISIQSPYSN